jgi:hypothetical protein
VRLVEHVGTVAEDQFLSVALEHRPARINQNGRTFVARLPPEPGEEMDTGLAAVQREVQDDGIQRILLGGVDRRGDRCGLHRYEALPPQQAAERALERRIIFDDQDDWRSCRRVDKSRAVVDIWNCSQICSSLEL